MPIPIDFSDVETGPQCPRCHAEMVKRHSKYGWFWGCSRYPDCKGTVNISESERFSPGFKMPNGYVWHARYGRPYGSVVDEVNKRAQRSTAPSLPDLTGVPPIFVMAVLAELGVIKSDDDYAVWMNKHYPCCVKTTPVVINL